MRSHLQRNTQKAPAAACPRVCFDVTPHNEAAFLKQWKDTATSKHVSWAPVNRAKRNTEALTLAYINLSSAPPSTTPPHQRRVYPSFSDSILISYPFSRFLHLIFIAFFRHGEHVAAIAIYYLLVLLPACRP